MGNPPEAPATDRAPRYTLETVAVDADIDELGHVSNLTYVRWVLEVAEAHSSSVGYDAGAYRRLGAAFVVRRQEIDYLRPAYAGDRILLTTWVSSWGGASSIRRTSITRADGVELARAATTWAFVSADRGRPRRIPPELKERFTPGAGPG